VIPKGTRPEVVHSTLNSSPLWDFCEVLTLIKNMRLLNGASESDILERKLFSDWVLGIGDGQLVKAMTLIYQLLFQLIYLYLATETHSHLLFRALIQTC